MNFQRNKQYYIWIMAIGYLLFTTSCTKEDPSIIHLKWNKSYPEDTFARNQIGLKWCLSFLGATIALDTTLTGITYQDSIIRLDIKNVGFSEEAIGHLQRLQQEIKASEEYQKNNTIDIGRYVASTVGSSFHYYKIAEVPKSLNALRSQYEFHSMQGYITNSSISNVDRIIDFSPSEQGKKQVFISTEMDSITQTPLEFESLELMENGQLRFGIYDPQGNLKDAADPMVTRAGKPAKCLWCHEANIQPMFRTQLDITGYFTYKQLQDSLATYDKVLKEHQRTIWRDTAVAHRKLHTEMELIYISFMEPSAMHLSREWNLPEKTVKEKLQHLPTHNHHEFHFMKNLYHRSAVDSLAPFKGFPVPESIREKSQHELDYIPTS